MPTLLRALDGESLQIFNSGNSNKFSVSLDASSVLNFTLDANATSLSVGKDAVIVGASTFYANSIEVKSAASNGNTPFIDFHYGDNTTDYNVRIINAVDKELDIRALGTAAILRVNGHEVWHTNNFNPADKLDTTIAYVGLDTTGSTTFPRIIFNNNPGTDTVGWVRVNSTGGGIIPYSDGNSYIGGAAWKFKEIHAVNFYENGTALSSKYDKYSSWTLKAPATDSTGTTITSGTSVVINGTGNTTVTRSGTTVTINSPTTAPVHGDEAHNHTKFARMTFSASTPTIIGKKWTHWLNSPNVIFSITANSPETHYYYQIVDNNNVNIYLDDAPFNDIVLDIVATIPNAGHYTNTGFLDLTS